MVSTAFHSKALTQTRPRSACPGRAGQPHTAAIGDCNHGHHALRPFHSRPAPMGRASSRWHVYASAEGSGEPQLWSKQVQVTLKRPLGMVLAEDTERGVVFVEEIVPSGNADESGKVKVGDVVSKVSAIVLKAGKEGQYQNEGYGQRPYDNWDQVLFDCKGQDFKTVMSAIDSNNPRWGINTVTLVLQRPQ